MPKPIPNPNPKPYPWSTSTRHARLPKDWAKRRAAVRARARGMCQASTHVPECRGMGNECDHIINNDDHSMGNLQWLSAACHRAKTLTEALASRGHGTGRLRTPEMHPGMITRP